MVKKKTKAKTAEAVAVDPKVEAIAHAQSQIERFQKMRMETTDIERVKQADFWITHWTTELAKLRQE